MVAQQGPALEPGYKPAREHAADRHNLILADHQCRVLSGGDFLTYLCIPHGEQFPSAVAWDNHIRAVIRDTPVRA